MKRKIEAVAEYFNADLGCMVKVYPEKQRKHTPWQRGEAYLGMKMRIQEDTGAMMYQFTRKTGRY